jgi:hypothetical protein
MHSRIFAATDQKEVNHGNSARYYLPQARVNQTMSPERFIRVF